MASKPDDSLNEKLEDINEQITYPHRSTYGEQKGTVYAIVAVAKAIVYLAEVISKGRNF